MALPSSSSFVELHLLNGGSFLANTTKLHAGVQDETFRMYDWCFYLFHPQSKRHVLWDVGLSGNNSDYTPCVVKNLLEPTSAVGPRLSLVEQLAGLGVHAHQINDVIFSHAHFDHCRPIRDEFPNARGHFGPGTREFCSPGHLVNGQSNETVQWDGRFFSLEKASERWETLSGPWIQLGPFERAMDFFHDGSFWVIEAPGHMPGNLCAAARLQTGEWVVLGSDCCHSRALLNGEYDFAVWSLPDGSSACLQADIPAAKQTVKRLKMAEDTFGMHIAMAHDIDWMLKESDKTLMSILPMESKKSMLQTLRKGEIL